MALDEANKWLWENAEGRRDRIAELTRQGLPVSMIAEMLHVTERTVSRARVRRGVARPRRNYPLTPAEIERAKALLDDGASYKEVARTIGRGNAAIQKALPGYTWTRQQVGQAGVMAKKMAELERSINGCH